MNDFIFGTLATPELRRQRVQGLRAGVTHNHQREPYDPQPLQPVTLTLTVGPAHPGERAWAYWTTDDSDPQGNLGVVKCGFTAAMTPVSSVWDTELWGYIRTFKVEIPAQPAGTIVRYRLGLEVPGQGEVFADRGAYDAYLVADDPLPEWARDAIIYHVFVDRFSPGEGQPWLSPASPSGFYGGKLAGVTQNLDYIAGMGFNCIWLSPIFPSPSHHGYDATDLLAVEPRLGTKADLRQLLDEAHARGLRVILDYVPNHWSYLHDTFQDAIHNPQSIYREWYNFIHWPDEYETFFGVKELPQVNLRNPAAKKHMLDALVYWLEFGVDGYRVDYAVGVAHDFWADFRKVTRKAKPDSWSFGEVVDPPDVQLSFYGLMDGCLDFILLEALRQTIAFERWTPAQFACFIDRHESAFPVDFSRPSFLDNHDMNRMLWACQNEKERLKLAALCQFTLVGPPIVYYGTEVGLSQQRDVRQGEFGLPEEARLPMLWGDEQDTELCQFYRQLIHLRRDTEALRRGARQNLTVDGQGLLYRRFTDTGDVLVALNFSRQPWVVEIPQGFIQGRIATQAGWKINAARLELPPSGGVVLSKE